MEYKTSAQIAEEQRIRRNISKYVEERQLMDTYEADIERQKRIHEEKLYQEHMKEYEYPKLENMPEYEVLLDKIDELGIAYKYGGSTDEIVNQINYYFNLINKRGLWTQETMSYVQEKINSVRKGKSL